MCLATIEFAPGVVVDSHKHDVDQLGTVVKGQLVLAVAGEQRVLVEGDSYRVPAGVAHGARVLEEATTVVVSYAPPPDDLKRIFEQQNATRERV